MILPVSGLVRFTGARTIYLVETVEHRIIMVIGNIEVGEISPDQAKAIIKGVYES